LCEFRADNKWTLLYRASEHGFSGKDFHSRCDNHAKTLTVVKTTSGNIFGGYTEQTWNHCGGYKTDPSAFIFSLVNKENVPIKMRVKDAKFAIWCFSTRLPIFGENDFNIAPGANSNELSHSHLGKFYKHPIHGRRTSQSNCFLAGTADFRVSEVEIFKLV
jgi:protein sidekick